MPQPLSNRTAGFTDSVIRRMTRISMQYDAMPEDKVFSACIGCGQCVNKCKFDVREMVPDQRDVFVKTKKKTKGN